MDNFEACVLLRMPNWMASVTSRLFFSSNSTSIDYCHECEKAYLLVWKYSIRRNFPLFSSWKLIWNNHRWTVQILLFFDMWFCHELILFLLYKRYKIFSCFLAGGFRGKDCISFFHVEKQIQSERLLCYFKN